MRPQPLERRLAWGAEAIALCRGAELSGRPAAPDLLSRSLVLQAQLLLHAERYEEANAAAEESLNVPDAHPSSKQTAYCHLMRALALAGLDLPDDALVSARDSVAAYRTATPRHADRSLGGPATALRAHAWILGRAGRTAESVEVCLQCVGLLRELSGWQQLRLAVLHTRTPAELAGGLRVLGRFAEAVEAGDDARERVGSLTPGLYPETQVLCAQLLIDLAWCLGATGDLSAARATAEEAVSRCRILAAGAQAAGELLLVLALECLAHHLGLLDARTEERAVRGELVSPCAQLALAGPDAHEPRLADALDDLARCRTRDGEHPEAVAATERSVELYRRAVGRDPGPYEPEPARTLANLGVRLRLRGEFDGAVAAGEEALAITRRLAGAGGGADRSTVADRLMVLGRARYRAQDDEGAAACFEEAETLRRELMEAGDPGPYGAGIAAAQSALARALGAAVDGHLDAGRPDEATAALRRLKELTGRGPLSDVHATCLSTFARARDRDAEGTAGRRVSRGPPSSTGPAERGRYRAD
ncbi:tetratricopeptide repeat protein [Streptomyces sp. NBC_00876]|uniref:tetratricopeptide repeat protein n=1 Tax=Streptomyces sp. NBC_00876 TaxID=2975853 RepID=UPI0038650B38|nr:tetratricopeptide repeat protein [Streptomyces sp. NBC_00876]